jgi:hypothetical protein
MLTRGKAGLATNRVRHWAAQGYYTEVTHSRAGSRAVRRPDRGARAHGVGGTSRAADVASS